MAWHAVEIGWRANLRTGVETRQWTKENYNHATAGRNAKIQLTIHIASLVCVRRWVLALGDLTKTFSMECLHCRERRNDIIIFVVNDHKHDVHS